MSAPTRTVWSDLLWRAWGALGVSSWAQESVATVIDPEALIVASAVLDDARLFAETIDWGIVHAPLLMPSRLRRIATDADVTGQIESWIATVSIHTDGVRWKARAEPLAEYTPSGKSRHFGEGRGATAAVATLRMRAIAGATARTELLRALHPVARQLEPSRTATELITAAAIARGQASAQLDELVTAGLVDREGSARRRSYRPATHPGDVIASGWWLPWQQLPWGPWRELPALIGPLARLANPDPSTPAAVAAVSALHDWDRISPTIGRIDRSLVAPVTSTEPGTLNAELRARAHRATTSVIDQLTRPGNAS